MRIVIDVAFIVQNAHTADEACELLTKFVKEKVMPIANETAQNSLALIIKESNSYVEFLHKLKDFCENTNTIIKLNRHAMRKEVCNCTDCKIKRGEIIRKIVTVAKLPPELTEKVKKAKALSEEYNMLIQKLQDLEVEYVLACKEDRAARIAFTPEKYRNAPYHGTGLSEDLTEMTAYTDFDAKTCEVIQ